MSNIANTPEPPYYSVIFTSTLTSDTEGYAEMAEKWLLLLTLSRGFSE